MKIADVRTHLLEHALAAPFESASARFERRQHCLVEITCADGTVGWGECLGPAALNAAVVAGFRSLLLGQDPLATEVLWQRLYHTMRDQGQRGLTMTALSGIDVALWDIKGKRFGVPVSVLLGGRMRERVAAYATGGFRSGADRAARVARVAEECAGYAAEGFGSIKIKIGFGAAEDLATIAAVREAIGPRVGLMIDANHGYDALEAVVVGRAAAAYDIGWFEEPVLPEQLGAYRAVRAGQPIPVAGGETWHGRFAFREPLEDRAVDVAQPDLCGVGGYSEMRRVADMCALHGVRLVPHVWGTGVQLAASLQWLSAQLPDPPRPEPLEPLLEFDRTEMPFRQAILTTPIEHEAGLVEVPRGPGLGVEIDRAALSRFAPA